jgi:hypothetical protein
MSVRSAPAEPAAAHGASRLAAVLAAGMARLSLLPTGVKKGKEKASPRPDPTPEELAALQSVVSKRKGKAKKETHVERLVEDWDDHVLNTLIAKWLDKMGEKRLRSMMPRVIDWNSPWIADELAYLLRESDYDSKENGRDRVQNRIRKEVKRRVARIDEERAKRGEVDVDGGYLDEFAAQDSEDPKDYVDEAHLLEHLDKQSGELRSRETLADDL